MSFSKILQFGLGILTIILGGLDINNEAHVDTAEILNNTTTVLVVLIVMNSIIASGICINIVNQKFGERKEQ